MLKRTCSMRAHVQVNIANVPYNIHQQLYNDLSTFLSHSVLCGSDTGSYNNITHLVFNYRVHSSVGPSDTVFLLEQHIGCYAPVVLINTKIIITPEEFTYRFIEE